MDPVTITLIMDALSKLIPAGVQVYTAIQQANQSQYPPISELIAENDKLAAQMIATAQAEIAKLTPPTV